MGAGDQIDMAVALRLLAGAASGVTPVVGSFTGASVASALKPIANRTFNILIGTPGVVLGGTVQLERRFGGSAGTWQPVTYIDGTIIAWSTGVNASWSEGEADVEYRLNCLTWSSAIAYRVSQ